MMTSGYPRATSGDELSLMVAKAVLTLVSLLVGISAAVWLFVRGNVWWAAIVLLVIPVLWAAIGGAVARLYQRLYQWAHAPRAPFYRPNLVYLAAIWPITLMALLVGVLLTATINRLFPAEAH